MTEKRKTLPFNDTGFMTFKRLTNIMVIPQEIQLILEKLHEQGFEAYAVGGCVRDLLLGKKPKDWDITTNATPEQIQQVFPKNFYENKFGTVTVQLASNDPTLKEIEITTYRVDEKYSDKRHPDAVRFTDSLTEDLARRDFTINAMALGIGIKNYESKITKNKRTSHNSLFIIHDSNLIDPFNGQQDLADGLIRAVGNPEERFNEDALRMLRAVRFSMELSSGNGVEQGSEKRPFTPLENTNNNFLSTSSRLVDGKNNSLTGFTIEESTRSAIEKNAQWLQAIAKERVRDELIKIIMTDRAADGIILLHDLNLLQYIIPELEKGVGVAQNRHHIYTIFEHCVYSLKFAAQKNYNLVVRMAALLHDIAKPQTKSGEGSDATFYNHDILGARFAARILDRLKFPRQTIEAAANLIRHHMFVYDVGAVTEAGVRRLLRRVGPENMKDLIAVRVADRLGSGVPKAQPYRLRHFQYMLEKVQNDPISVKMLKINGNDLIKILGIKPGPKIGAILDVLLAEAIENPAVNNEKYLAERAEQLNQMDLTQLRQIAKEKIEEKKEEDDKIIKGKYWVQ